MLCHFIKALAHSLIEEIPQKLLGLANTTGNKKNTNNFLGQSSNKSNGYSSSSNKKTKKKKRGRLPQSPPSSQKSNCSSVGKEETGDMKNEWTLKKEQLYMVSSSKLLDCQLRLP
jgi:hypothetical protein